MRPSRDEHPVALALLRRGSLRLRALVLMIVVLATASCATATSSSSAQESITSGLEEARSAVATAALVVTLLEDDRMTAPVADTGLLDQIGVLEDSSAALTTLVPPAEMATPLQQGMTAVGTATDAVVAARLWVNGESGASAAELLEALEGAESEIDDVLAEVGA